MAGIGEACSNIAAVLFKVEASVREHIRTAPTEVANKWNNAYRKKTDVMPLCELSLEAPRLTAKKRKMASASTVNPDMSFDAFQNDLHHLHDIFPEATIFTSVHPTDSETDSVSEGEEPNYFSVSNLFSQLSTSEISVQNIEDVIQKYKQYTITQATCIEQATKSQSENPNMALT